MARRYATRATAITLVLLLLLPLFSGCKVKLYLSARKDESILSAPLLRGTRYADSLDAKLLLLFDPLLQTAAALKSAGIDIALHYELTETQSGMVLKTTLYGKGTASAIKSVAMMNKGSVTLPELTITDKGELLGAQGYDAAMLADREYFKHLLLLSALHVPFTVSDYNKEATERGIAQYAVSLYESFKASEIDIRNSLPTVKDALSAKSYAIGLYEYYADIPAVEEVFMYPSRFYATVGNYQNGLYDLLFTDSARIATIGDAENALTVMLSSTGLMGGKTVSQILSRYEEHLQDPLTRLLWASLCRQLLKELIPDPPDGEYFEYPVEDSKSEDVKFALGYGLVQSYPGFGTYMPNQNIRLYQLSGLCARLVARLCELDRSKGTLGQIKTIRNNQTIGYFADLAAYCLDASGAKDTTVRIANTRPYSFYYRQANTGRYSDVNCMPTLTCMCLKWQNESFSKTPEQIRQATDPAGTGGWSLYTAEKALDANGAKYEQWTLSYESADDNIQKMMSELDCGRVLYCMINEADLRNDGHCMLVYGYEKSGDNVWFLVYDPGLGTATDVYGRPLGQIRKLEAHYAQWITQRWSYAVLSILP